MIKIKVKLKNKDGYKENIFNAIKKDNVIIYQDDNDKIKILENKIIKENNDYLLELDFLNGLLIIKKENKQLETNMEVIYFNQTSSKLKVKYKIDDEILYEYEEVK